MFSVYGIYLTSVFLTPPPFPFQEIKICATVHFYIISVCPKRVLSEYIAYSIYYRYPDVMRLLLISISKSREIFCCAPGPSRLDQNKPTVPSIWV